jgi:hypothetical protein
VPEKDALDNVAGKGEQRSVYGIERNVDDERVRGSCHLPVVLINGVKENTVVV